MAEFASNAKANAGLTTGIIGSVGTTGWLLNGLGNLLRGWGNQGCVCSENTPVNRFELEREQEIAELKTRNSLLEGTIYTDKKSLEIYAYFDGQNKQVNEKLCMQNVWNAAQEARIRDLERALKEITTLKIDGDKMCPEYMPRFNSWIAPAATDTATAPGA